MSPMPRQAIPQSEPQATRHRAWTLAALVTVLILAVGAVVWWQVERAHALMRQQILAQAEQRSLQLADAMAGQMGGLMGSLDLALRQLRRDWDGDPGRFDTRARAVLDTLPPGAVSHVTVVGEDGFVIYNSLGVHQRTYVGDRAHFKAHLSGGDRLVIGKPVMSRLGNVWTFIVNRPILRGGHFAGTMNISVSPEYLSAKLAALRLPDQDVIALLHADGSFLARSQDFLQAMGRGVPADQPFLAAGAPVQGVFRMPGVLDRKPRIYAWHRLEDYSLITTIGLVEGSVLAPLDAVMARDHLISAGLVALLAIFGGIVILLLLRSAREQAQIAASEAFRQRVFDSSPIPIVVMDAGTFEFLDCNPAATKIYRYASRAETLGKTPQDVSAPLQYDGTPSAEKFIAHIREAQREGGVTFEWRHQRPDGEIWDAEVNLLSFQAGPRRLLQFTLLDITERKRTEAALQRLNEELEERVRLRTVELLAAKEEAEQASRAKSEFLSRMSHELRTPLNAILGFGQLLELETRDPEQADNVQEILHAGHHLLELINEVLDLARIEAGRLTVSCEPVPLMPLVEECLTLIRPLAEARRIRVAETGRDCGEHVLADRVRLKQVLLNLLSNAVKYNREGGDIAIACVLEGGLVQVLVSDTGSGLTAEQQGRLFIAFERLDADQQAIEGTGIGLALSKRLVELMEGEIGVESTPGQGSTFWVRLPATDGQALPDRPAAGAEVQDSAAVRGPRQEVLCIEDNPANLRLIQRILARREDVRLLAAATPTRGLELAMAHRPALILLDINLPDMDGYEVMTCLRENPATRHIPVVAVSANAMPADLARGKAAGFADYLTKPIDMDRLLGVLDRIHGGNREVEMP